MDRAQLNLRVDGTPVTDAVRFNLYPGSYIHGDWFASLKHGAIIQEILTVDPFEKSISRYLLREFEIEDLYTLEFERPVYRLALRDRETIEEYVLFLGLYLNRNQILKSIRGECVRRLARELSDTGRALLQDLYRGQLLARETPGIKPGAFARSPLKAIQISGELALTKALRTAPKALSQRCWIKLGPRFSTLPEVHVPTVDANEIDATINRFFDLKNADTAPQPEYAI